MQSIRDTPFWLPDIKDNRWRGPGEDDEPQRRQPAPGWWRFLKEDEEWVKWHR